MYICSYSYSLDWEHGLFIFFTETDSLVKYLTIKYTGPVTETNVVLMYSLK